jgi:hypothetical protein
LLSRILVGFLAFVLATSSFGIAFAGTTGGVRGRVLDRDTQKGIAGVKVTVASPSQSATATTDANGAFVFISLIPDTYTISVQPSGYDVVVQPGLTIIADQVQSIALTPGKINVTIGRTTNRPSSSLVKSGVTGDVYSVNAAGAEAAQAIGGAGSINQAYSAMASVPGVSLQMGQQGWNQAVYVRGGDYEDVAYELDGIPVQRASDGAPITTLTNLGQGELQVYTGGAPASADASGLSGYVNQVVRSGTAPGFADLQIGAGGSALYNKLQGEVGGATKSGNFTYYVGALAVDQGYRYGDNFNGASNPLFFYPLGYDQNGNFITSPGQSYSIASSTDREVIANLHYYIKHKHDDGRDDIQFLYANGRIAAQFYSSVNDLGGAGPVSNVIGETYFGGTPTPAHSINRSTRTTSPPTTTRAARRISSNRRCRRTIATPTTTTSRSQSCSGSATSTTTPTCACSPTPRTTTGSSTARSATICRTRARSPTTRSTATPSASTRATKTNSTPRIF